MKTFIQLNTFFKDIKNILIDRHCKHCKKELEDIKKDNIPYHSIIVLKPSYNSAGVITHYHIETIDVENDKIYKEFTELTKWVCENAIKDYKNIL